MMLFKVMVLCMIVVVIMGKQKCPGFLQPNKSAMQEKYGGAKAAEHPLNRALIPLQEIVPGETRILTKFVEDHFVPESLDFKTSSLRLSKRRTCSPAPGSVHEVFFRFFFLAAANEDNHKNSTSKGSHPPPDLQFF